MNYRRIMLPTDGSPLAAAALPHVRLIGAATHAEILVLRVVPTREQAIAAAGIAILLPISGQIAAASTESADEEAAIAADQVRSLRDTLEADGLRCAAPRVVRGVPGAVIVETAENLSCDLIVLSAHGRSGVRRLVLGSVADYVLRHVQHAAVLLCRSS